MSMAALAPVVLTGTHVELQPLSLRHVSGLADAYEPGTMDLFSATADVLEPIDEPHARRYVEEALAGHAAGRYLPFAVVDRASGTVVGATRYGNVDMDVPRVEVGWTWYASSVRGTHVNPECKLLLLRHAFEQLSCRVVTFRTSAFNVRSRRAIAGLGATVDGVLRCDRRQRDGRVRDTACFSILAEEWPLVQARLEARLGPDARSKQRAVVELRRAVEQDAPELLAYVLRNREFHEPFEPIRGEDRLTVEAIAHQLRASGERRIQFVATDGDVRIVGQAALSNVARVPAFLSCTLGYSVDEHEQGRGIATALVRHAVGDAFGRLGLHRVEAGTLLDNRPSQRVLERCGFTRIGVSPRHVRIAGRWQDHMLYAITAEDQSDQDRPAR